MWISFMNLLMILAILLLLLFTGIGISSYLKGRKSWKEIEVKANESGIKGFDE